MLNSFTVTRDVYIIEVYLNICKYKLNTNDLLHKNPPWQHPGWFPGYQGG